MRKGVPVECVATNVSVGCSTTTHERREGIRLNRFGGELGHYGFAERFIAVSCCRSARFSKTNSRWPRSANGIARGTTMSSSTMHRSWLASMRQINPDEFWRGSTGHYKPTQGLELAAATMPRISMTARPFSVTTTSSC